jgi:hypothetical protein
MSKDFKPAKGHYVLRLKSVSPKKELSNIILPEGVKLPEGKEYYEEHPIQGEVIYAGDKAHENADSYSKGDVVYLMNTSSMIPVVIKKEYLTVVTINDIIGKEI